MMVGRWPRFTLNRDIRARMPPSPSVAMRIAEVTYLTQVIMISVQITSDSGPSTVDASGLSPARLNTVFRVYSGLVPISPNTTPSAARLSDGRLAAIRGRAPFAATADGDRKSVV